MRLIFADEAGTSASNPLCVVAAVIVDDDWQKAYVTEKIDRLIQDRVPPQISRLFAGGFYLHTTDILHGKIQKKRISPDIWSLKDRIDFLVSMSSVMFDCDIPIAISMKRKTDLLGSFGLDGTKLQSTDELYHFLCFSECMDRADLFLTKYLEGKETATVIAESVRMQNILETFGLILREQPFAVSPGSHDPTTLDRMLGREPDCRPYQIHKIVGRPRFVPKGTEPLLQLADLCAYAFRRYFSGHGGAEDMLLAMLGPDAGRTLIADPAWKGDGSNGLFNTTAYWSEAYRRELAAQSAELQKVLEVRAFLARLNGGTP